MTTHKCPLSGCVHRIPKSKLLCRVHWHLTPNYLKARYYAAWEVYLRAQSLEPCDQKAAVDELRAVQRDILTYHRSSSGGAA